MEALGVTAEELDITPTAKLMLEEIGHPFARGEEVYDVTFENVQAGLRTDYLFRIANQRGGIVLGTGDLSELALGWATYGVGDQMSHYNVNGGVPKTFIQHLIRWVIKTEQFEDEVSATLASILDTEISPELVPGEELQSTESQIGPYALHDFSLFYTLRYGFRPSKIGFMAWHAWRDSDAGTWPPNFPDEKRVAYDRPEIRRWLELFCKRFFAFAQFKRSALPNGPKVLGGRLAVAARRLAGAVGRLGRRVAARPRALRRRGRLGLTQPPAAVRRAAAAFGLDGGALRSLGGASGATWSDGEVVLRVGERVAGEVAAATAAAARVPVPRVLGQIEGAVLLELVPGQPAGELADPEHAAAAGRACGALHGRLAGVAAPEGLRELPGRERNLLHLDLHPYNVLVDDAGEVTAVIDWTNAAAGDPQLDAARTWSILTLDPAALARRADPGWAALTEAWLEPAGCRRSRRPARAWACRFMLADLAKRHDAAGLQHVRSALRNLE